MGVVTLRDAIRGGARLNKAGLEGAFASCCLGRGLARLVYSVAVLLSRTFPEPGTEGARACACVVWGTAGHGQGRPLLPFPLAEATVRTPVCSPPTWERAGSRVRSASSFF